MSPDAQLASCHYAGDISDALEQCAPHLVQLDYEDTRHRFLMVQDHGNRRLAFRYYDPRVLQVYIDRFWTRGEDPSHLLTFLRKNRAISVEEIRIGRRGQNMSMTVRWGGPHGPRGTASSRSGRPGGRLRSRGNAPLTLTFSLRQPTSSPLCWRPGGTLWRVK